MPSKYQVITEMEAEHLRTLTVDTNHYMDFLTTAANNFKYSFQEQLLIFAQKPDATACAEVSWWNKHGRWVNRNTKGIALLVDTDAPYKLRPVFDVSDTNSRAGKEVPIWKMEQRFVEPVKKVLAERYEVDTHESLEDCLLNVAVTFVNDNYQDYLAELSIDGYTDTSGDYVYNLELSQARALAVASYLFQDADSFLTADELTSLKEKLTSNGHSMSNPVYSDGEVNMDASRRVEVRFRLKDEEMINELKDVLAKTATAQSE